MLVPGWWYVISAESFLDRMTEMPDVLELAPTIRCPTLFIRGDEESAELRNEGSLRREPVRGTRMRQVPPRIPDRVSAKRPIGCCGC
jgi:hypothetical protein